MAPKAHADERRPLLSGGESLDNVTIQRDTEANNEAGASGPASGAQEANDDTVYTDEPTTVQIVTIMSSVWMGTFLAALDGTMVATLTAPISASFNSLSLFSWLASAYFIANAALQPLSGKLTDIFGRRAGLIFSNIFFAAGNLICGLAKDEWVIIFGRVVAGMGGGGLTAISTFIGSDIVPLRRRGIWQGVGNIFFGIGAGVGSIFGGFVNDRLGWRWAFIILVPFSVLSMIIVIFTVKIPIKDTSENRFKRIDFLGASLLVVTLVLMLLGLNSGGNVVPWTHPLVLVTLPLSVLFLIMFVYAEAKIAPEPIIPVWLLTKRTTLASCLTNWFQTMGMFGMLFYVPIYFQSKGLSSTAAGERLVPYSVGVALGSICVGVWMRWLGRYWWINIAVQTISIIGFVLLSTLDLHTPQWPPFIYLFIIGAGYSGMLTVMLMSLIAAVEHKYQAVITSASYAFRSTGTTIGITVCSAVFQNVLTSQLWSRLGDREHSGDYIRRVRDSLDEIGKLPESWQAPVIDSYMAASRAVFLTTLGLVAIGSLISLFIRENKLYNTVSRRD